LPRRAVEGSAVALAFAVSLAFLSVIPAGNLLFGHPHTSPKLVILSEAAQLYRAAQ